MVGINSANKDDLNQFRDVIQLFIEGKMNSYNKIQVRCNSSEESISIENKKYRASLFMMHEMLKTMGTNEIAETLDIPHDLLRKWKNEKTFINNCPDPVSSALHGRPVPGCCACGQSRVHVY